MARMDGQPTQQHRLPLRLRGVQVLDKEKNSALHGRQLQAARMPLCFVNSKVALHLQQQPFAHAGELCGLKI